MSDNLAIWNKLGRTDPDHTKGFQRGGGFKGTAIKPIYTEQKMTEVFGPCGIGWGFTEPRFELVPASDGQTAVYCWLTLWYVHEGKKSDPIPGVGGDFVVVKQSSGLRTNDEAFKAAFTDAIGNAMKHLGMSADVHMGLFDDSKYVRSLREDKEPAAPRSPSTGSRGAGAAPSPAPAPANHQPSSAVNYNPNHPAHVYVSVCLRAISAATSVEDLRDWWDAEADGRAEHGITKGDPLHKTLIDALVARKDQIELADLPAGQLEAAE